MILGYIGWFSQEWHICVPHIHTVTSKLFKSIYIIQSMPLRYKKEHLRLEDSRHGSLRFHPVFHDPTGSTILYQNISMICLCFNSLSGWYMLFPVSTRLSLTAWERFLFLTRWTNQSGKINRTIRNGAQTHGTIRNQTRFINLHMEPHITLYPMTLW